MVSFVKGQHVDLQFLIKVPMKEYLLAVSISKSISPGFLAWNEELNRSQWHLQMPQVSYNKISSFIVCLSC